MKYYLIIITLALMSCSQTKVANSDNDAEEKRIDSILAQMSIDAKIGQTNLRGTSSGATTLSEALKEDVRQGKVGALLNVMNVEFVDELQRIAVEESPNKIPLIFARDVIHGFKTMFPIPLGMAASWDVDVAKNSAMVSAKEASSVGIKWTFAPMLDIARDSRWGRIAESPGEDPYLASVLGKAYVEGFQGEDLSSTNSIAACAKHYIGYGAAIGGRDYNTTYIPEPLLQNVYLPPFESAINADVATVMTAFNEVNGVPASGHKYLLRDVLKDKLKFDGFVVSDWESVTEMIPHGYAKDEKHAAQLSANAGLDMEMTSKAYEHHLKNLIEEGKVSEAQLDAFVKNILRIKLRLGLFETPFRDKNNTANFYNKEDLELAKDAAVKSTVMLKNANVLPLNKNTKIALIGPLADAPLDQMGTWTFDGEKEHTITPLSSFKTANINYNYVAGLTHSRDLKKTQFNKVLAAAKQSDVVVFVAGEEAILSGEAHSRASIGLPGAQEDLIKALAKTGKPIVLSIMAGRPISITNIYKDVDAILMCWHPGTMGGPALTDIIFGITEPQGRLPVSWPITAGQLPYFYNHKNTGRPAVKEDYVAIYDIPVGAWQSSLGNDSHYLDIGYKPHFPFGYGLGYTSFEYENIAVSKDTIHFDETIKIKASITNSGQRAGKEVVQLYIQDVTGSITRPIRELKRFKHIQLKSGETQEVTFTLSSKDLEFTNSELIRAAEEGDFNVWIGPNAATGLKDKFYLAQ
ncbi:glycoside hydrolase family 3 N-terminal domain-containing protein [Hyunsoonleella ulvae]|uniref:glycoside hydrolase family 3 N-terminal domain-containing protein n=1 Tax=Hyunsoonleella ulvae TaxID=2799948 RepID=UPI00193976DC|nr:glycoside hydrolase family 3 N-terminal domain-containing protein [Hyunsoonleella ulvae]